MEVTFSFKKKFFPHKTFWLSILIFLECLLDFLHSSKSGLYILLLNQLHCFQHHIYFSYLASFFNFCQSTPSSNFQKRKVKGNCKVSCCYYNILPQTQQLKIIQMCYCNSPIGYMCKIRTSAGLNSYLQTLRHYLFQLPVVSCILWLIVSVPSFSRSAMWHLSEHCSVVTFPTDQEEKVSHF